MAITSIKDVINAELEGRVRNYTWRKTPSQTTTAATWFDLSMSPGNPPPKYWFDAAPLTAKAVYQSTDGGLFHGSDVTPYVKYLRSLTAMTITATSLPLNMYLCDYLIYYPSIDDGTTDPQPMINTVTLPRYTTGSGVQMVAVTVAARTGGQQFYVTYTNSDGVAGRVSQTVTQNASTSIGTVVTSASAVQASGNPFIGLQSGDSGVRYIESVTMLGGDVGLMSIILVKPITQICIRGIDAPVEKDFLLTQNELPTIYDNAFLSLLCLPQGSLAATALIGDMKVVWSN
jgi:hypothetical protein